MSRRRSMLLLDENLGLRVYEELKRRDMKFKQLSVSYGVPHMWRFSE